MDQRLARAPIQRHAHGLQLRTGELAGRCECMNHSGCRGHGRSITKRHREMRRRRRAALQNTGAFAGCLQQRTQEDPLLRVLAERLRDLFRRPEVVRPAEELSIEARPALLDMRKGGLAYVWRETTEADVPAARISWGSRPLISAHPRRFGRGSACVYARPHSETLRLGQTERAFSPSPRMRGSEMRAAGAPFDLGRKLVDGGYDQREEVVRIRQN